MSVVSVPVPAVSDPIDLEDLRQLMRTVTETTERLESTHASLQREVARLKAELADANERLRRSRALAALGEMAAGIAHEVRNPLGSIGLYAQMLREDVAGRPGPARLCDRIGRAVERIDAIVRDVLRFARDTALQPALVTVDTVIDDALETCRSLLAETGIVVDSETPEADLEIEADGPLLTQALANVVRNAAEAVAEAGEAARNVTVRASRESRRPAAGGGRAPHVVVGVHDRGPGLEADVLGRMFNPFFTTRRTGTGLGLAIVNRIVEAHGGHVHVANREGGGATVELCLPERPTKARRAKREQDTDR